MNHISKTDLQAIVDLINVETISPLELYKKVSDRYEANVGCYHISEAYGGVALHRMSDTDGGIEDVFGCGHRSKRELYGRLRGFLSGIYAGRHQS